MATDPGQSRSRPWDTGVGRRAVRAPWVIGATVFFLAASLILLYALWQFWPPSGAMGQPPPASSRVRFLWWDFALSRERNFFVIVAIAGGLGAMGHVLRSFFRYVGERYLLWSWMLSYLLIPLVGAILGTLVYILLRAGLITGGGAAQGDPFGFAAVAALVGLFSAQAAEKLKQVFETIFAAPQAGGESATAGFTPAPVIRGFTPTSGAPGTAVTVEGDALEEVQEVIFGGVSAGAEFDVDAGVLRTTVPQGAATGALAVRIGTITSESVSVFRVE